MDESFPKTKDIIKGVFGAMKEYNHLTSELPIEDYDYHMAFPGFRRQVKRHMESLVDLVDKCCQQLPARRRVKLQDGTGTLNDQQRSTIIEAADSLLENVDSLLDDLKGRRLRANDQLSVTFGSELQCPSASSPEGRVLRPQLTFEEPVDNSSAPFRAVYHDMHGERHVAEPGMHPFEELIKKASIPEEQLLRQAETPYLALPVCPLRFIDTVSDLQDAIAVILQENEIAVDLEHHDFYSYQGFTCLMQISTRKEDFVIDCLKLRSSMHLFAPVFLEPRILKVFHGAREDVRWLQKDFGLYLVNFFDTGIALQTLHMPRSLAFAVDHFCQVKLNKKYQTADWRIRPIPAEMVSYARQDTHFLLYVYDRLKALLLNSEGRASVGNLLIHVLNESRRLSLELYEKPKLDADTTYKLALGRSLGGLTASQLRVARDIFNWRDAAAREVDDSPAAVMHLSSVLAIATKLPTSASELLRCCNPVSVVTQTNVMKLVQTVKDAMGFMAATSTDDNGNEEDMECKKNSSESSKQTTTTRPVRMHRPMTGTLPSIEHPEDPIPVGDEESVVVRSDPSPWFIAMRRLAKVLRERQLPTIAIPGQEVVTLVMQAMASSKRSRDEAEIMNEAEMKEEAPASQEGEKVAEDRETESVPVHTEEKDERPGLDIGGERAVALRQKYGTGGSNRKKLRVEKVNSKKK